MKLDDVRRLTGPNLYSKGPGVIVELLLGDAEPAPSLTPILHEWDALRARFGVPGGGDAIVRRSKGRIALVRSGPIDTLLADAELAEWAVERVLAVHHGGTAPDDDAKLALVTPLVESLRSERLLALEAEAKERELPFLWDDDTVAIGTGPRAVSWPRASLPTVAEVDWDTLGHVPIAIITGTNGKTTSTRLLARMAREGGLIAAATSTDGVTVGDAIIEAGDCTGPFAARKALLRPEIGVALLETARGGILRRGLAVDGADVALITNVSDDHLGTYGIDDVASMARVKAVVATAVRPGGVVVLNAEDENLQRLGDELARDGLGRRVAWFSPDESHPILVGARARGLDVWTTHSGEIIRRDQHGDHAIAPVGAIPITFGGRARFNVENALAAAAAAHALGVPDAAIARALLGFLPTRDDNPGRGNVIDVHGVKVLLDFAHNAQGIRAVSSLAKALSDGHRLFVSTAHPGDRSDDALSETSAIIAASTPEHVYIRELIGYLRGRAPGETPAKLREALQRHGLPASSVIDAADEVDALKRALAVAGPGDVILMLVHVEREAVAGALAQAMATAAT
ncbi:MAG: hypothetical protein IV100_13210 [Myxococcales bacterium]|nr:hypothetical protein [Myxococcales bacterium]